MSEVIVAEFSGICFGVKRAISLLDRACKEDDNRKVSMLGPLIHNPRLIEDYKAKGVDVVNIDQVFDDSVVVVRSHGITKEEADYLLSLKDVEVVDTTCPFVKKIHDIVHMKSKDGYAIVVLGDEIHSEVTGITSRIDGDYFVVSPSYFDRPDCLGETLSSFIETHHKIFVVAQTTSRFEIFEKLICKLEQESSITDFAYKNTICDATLQRQNAASKLAGSVDVMIVIGGKNSSNTSKLFSIVKSINSNSFWIESVNDIDESVNSKIKNADKIAVTAGASTPDSQIEEFLDFVKIGS